MDPKPQFFFYLAAVVCLALASLGETWKYGSRTRRGLKPLIALLPFGLLLALIPTLWNTGVIAF